MEIIVDSTGTVLGTNELKLETILTEFRNKSGDFFSRMASDIISGNMLKIESRVWLKKFLNIMKEAETLKMGIFKDYETSVRNLMENIEEANEVYRTGKLAESLVAGEKNSSGVDNEGGKIRIDGQGGVGDTTIENKSAVKFTFGNNSPEKSESLVAEKGKLAESLDAEENAGKKSPSSSQSKMKKKNSCVVDNKGGEINAKGQVGVGVTKIVNKGAVDFKF